LVVAAAAGRDKREGAPPISIEVESVAACRNQICFGLCSRRARATYTGRVRLRVTTAEAARANEELVGRASHDVDDDRRYAALNRFRLGDRNFLRILSAVSAENIAVDRRSVDLPLQQGRCRDCSNAARCSDLGNAGNLSRRIPVRLLDIASPTGAAGTLSPVSTARLRALACVFPGYLAYVLARVYWFALPFHPFCDRRLFPDAFAHQPRQGNADD